MGIGAILLLAAGVAMDATAVAAARGLAATRIRLRDAAAVGGFFGGAQAAMAGLGWLAGRHVGASVVAWDHWIAFAVLAGLGVKFMLDARKPPEPVEAVFGARVLGVLALATSIDALAIGVTLPMLDAPPGPSLVAIGVTTAGLSVAGLWAGRRLGALLGRRLDALGGLILVGLAGYVLVSHLTAG